MMIQSFIISLSTNEKAAGLARQLASSTGPACFTTILAEACTEKSALDENQTMMEEVVNEVIFEKA